MVVELSGNADTFAACFKQAMKQRGLKQIDLAIAAEAHGVKMGKSHVSQYVAGKTTSRSEM